MPDISLCNGKDCGVRLSCFRYRAKPSPYRQSWAGFDAEPHSKGCEHLMNIKNWPEGYLRAVMEGEGGDES